MAIVVKRKGHKEKFDEKKLYASIYAACASAHWNEESCEKIAAKITNAMKKLIKSRSTIKASEIHDKVSAQLKKIHKELSFFYDKHLPNLKRL